MGGALRTPDERFANLPGFPFAPRYREVGEGLRMHYVDEGSGSPVLLLHGEPSWSYLYRKMIPPLAAAGLRAIAPDLIGFGRSDKPAKRSDYSYQRHLDWVWELVTQLDLRGITLFCQDWGSLLGLRLAAEHADRFARAFVANGTLPLAKRPPNVAFRLWRGFARVSPSFPIGKIVARGCALSKLSDAERAAYDAPFPSEKYKAGARAFPQLVPTSAKDPAVPGNRAAWDALGRWEKPFLCVFGKDDPILGRADRAFIAHVPGAKGQPHDRLPGGHFIQEDQGEELARRLIAFVRENS